MSEQADIILVGGGVLGAAIAYQLIRKRAGRVLLLERNDLASGSTCRAEGLLLSANQAGALAPFIRQTRATLNNLSDQLADDLGFRQVGSIRTAASQARLVQLMGLVADCASQGQPFELLTGDSLRQQVPWLATELISRAVHFPEDGWIDPFRLTAGYLRAAQAHAQQARVKTDQLEVRTRCGVTRLRRQGRRVIGVTTESGQAIDAPLVINAAGVWASLLAEELAQDGPLPNLPFVPLRQHHWVTKPTAAFPASQPIVVIPEARAVTRPNGGGLQLSVQELESLPFDARKLSGDAQALAQAEVDNPWRTLAESAAELRHFFPGILASHWDFYVANLEAHTPDGYPLLGAWPGLEGLLVATGLGGQAVAASAGLAEVIADLALGQDNPHDLSRFALTRFGRVDAYGADFRHRCLTARADRQKATL